MRPPPASTSRRRCARRVFSAAGSRRAHNLDSLSLHFFDIKKIPTKDLIGSGTKQITMAEVPVERVAEYACEDADCTYRLADILAKELEESGTQQLLARGHGRWELSLDPVRGPRVVETRELDLAGNDLERGEKSGLTAERTFVYR